MVVVVAGLLTGALPGGPATADPSEEVPEFSLSVSPARIVVPTGQLGDRTQLRVRNRGSKPVEVVVQRTDLAAAPDGSARFPEHAPYSAKDWITATPERAVIPPGQEQLLSVSVQLPEDFEPGDHHAALVVMVPAPEQPGTVRVNRGIGVPVYVQAPGVVDRTVVLEDFQGPRFAVFGPIQFQARLRHTGTVHRDFRGPDQLQIKVGDRSVPVPELTLLREATREVVVDWPDPPLWCICRATLAVPGPDGHVQQRTVEVTIIPLHLIGAGLVILAAAGGYQVIRRRRRRLTLTRGERPVLQAG